MQSMIRIDKLNSGIITTIYYNHSRKGYDEKHVHITPYA